MFDSFLEYYKTGGSYFTDLSGSLQSTFLIRSVNKRSVTCCMSEISYVYLTKTKGELHDEDRSKHYRRRIS